MNGLMHESTETIDADALKQVGLVPSLLVAYFY